MILANSKPVGYRFVKTALGDVRQPVYACTLHDCTEAARVTKARTARKRA